MYRVWMEHFREGDRVEYVGPARSIPGLPTQGERGWVIGIDPPDEWMVTWDTAGPTVSGPSLIKKVDDRNEPDPQKRLPGDPFGSQ
jgi:hypothetical protein